MEEIGKSIHGTLAAAQWSGCPRGSGRGGSGAGEGLIWVMVHHGESVESNMKKGDIRRGDCVGR